MSGWLLELQQKLERGEVPEVSELLKTVKLAVEALSTNLEGGTVRSEEDKLEGIGDWQVREWLSNTFTHSDSIYESRPARKNFITKFKAAANTIMISNFLGNIHKDTPAELHFSKALSQHLQHIDDWDFDVFELDGLTGGSPLRYVAHHLMKRHNLFEKCEISVSKFDSFLVRIEDGYHHHGNPYHNACHGADVAQTIHYILHATGFEALLSSIELLSMLLAAIIHDVDHPGTSNNFQINQHTEYALLYNDRSVLENHHLHFSFTVLQEADCNFLNFSSDDFKLLRGLMIEMVLATDMSSHFDQLKHMRHIMSLPEGCSQLQGAERAKMFGLLLHQADISHPGKPWDLHHAWSTRLAEEFYKQGDEEKRQGLPISPLCNRNASNLSKSQLGFIEFIVAPSFQLCGDMLKLVLVTSPAHKTSHDQSHDPAQLVQAQINMWDWFIAENKLQWVEQRSLTVHSMGGSEVATKKKQEGAPLVATPILHEGHNTS